MKRMYLLVPIMLVVSLMILSMALPASANRPFQYGDLIAIMDDGRVIHIAPTGQRIDVMNVGFRMTGLADCDFDPAGNLYIATGGGGQVIRFSGPQFPRVNLGPWGTYDAGPQSIWFDNSFGAYIGLANGTQDIVYRRDLPPVDRSFDVGLENGGANWVNNGPTGQSNIIAYTSNGITIRRYDVGADAQALDFGSLASGDIAQDFDYGSGQSPYNISVIVTRGRDVVAMDSSGTLGASIADATNAQGWFSVDADPSETLLPYPFFWAADITTDSIYRFREGTPVQEQRIRPDAEIGQLIGMCVYDDDDPSALPQPTPTPLPSQTPVPTETPTPLPTATPTATVTPVNQPPVANPDTIDRDYNGEQIVSIGSGELLRNDTDDGLLAPLSVVGIGQLPSLGTLTFTGDFFVYEAPECFAGEERFTYVISDGALLAEGQVNLLLSLVLPPPNAEDDTVGIATSGQPFIITRSDLARNDTISRCDDTITVEFGQPTNGTVVFDGTVVTYTSNPGFIGEDEFTYTLRNGSAEESTAQVSIMVSISDETPKPTVTLESTATATLTATAPATATATATPTITATPTVVSTLAPTATATLPAGIGLEVVQVNSASDDVNQEEVRLIDGNPFIWAGRGNAASTLTGLRFNAVDVPSGAIITDAYLELYSPADQWIQLDLIFTGDLSANSQPFNISLPGSRPRTFASVGYSANVYNTTGWVSFSGLTGIVQEIVNQSGWTSGNSLALLIDGLGSDWARKFYVAYELNPLQAARLVIRYQGGIEPANQAPMVNAGADQALTLPQDTIILNGFVSDDNLPLGSTLSISWMQVSGPAPVNFSNAGQAATLASFSAPGAYELRLTASDGALSSTDSLIVTVNPQPTSYAILTLPISAPTDDVNQEGTTLVDGSATVFFGRSNATPSLTGLRFTGVNLPPGAVIADAWLTVYSPFDQWIGVDIEVAGDLSANSLPFSSSALPGDRPRTSNRVSSGTNRLTPTGWASYTGLAGIVQEIVNQADWAAGNSLTLVIEGRGSDWARKFFTAYEADPALAPQLMIAWYLPDPTPIPPTTEPTVEAPVEATPTAEPSLEPTLEPTASPTPEPTVEPTLEATLEPTTTPVPTEVPPTSTPTPEPTLALVPTVTISADGLVGTAPLTVQFSSVVTDASDYAWDFGDGVGVSLEANPVYTFTTPGTYTVTLVVSGPGGLASSTLSITVQ
ncbi:MAG: PKD domain-containing protein [Anaerolineae bacterium]|nr:PKD domain-containing protein [Anaerolineae bacterium]